MSPPTLPYGFGGLPPELTDPRTARVAVLSVPYDMTTSYVAGARRGPEAIIEASRHMELFDEDERVDFSRVGIATCDPLCADSRGPELMAQAVDEAVAGLIAADKFALILGGEHSISLGAIRAAARRWPDLGVLQLDAHLDLRPSFEESSYNHACVMRRVRDDLGLPLVQVGVRSLSEEEHDYALTHHLQPFWARDLATADWPTRLRIIDDIVNSLPPQIYLSVDLDVLDPSVLPATGTPEPGGLDWYTVVELIRRVGAERQVVAADVVELAPIGGQVQSDFLAARLAYKIIGHAVALKVR